MKLPWHKLGLPSGHGGTIHDLKTYFGNDWNALSKYFLPTMRLATSISCPNPGGYGCPRKVVEHSFNDIVAVCGNSPKECDPVKLSRLDLVIHEMKIDKLLSDLCDLLRIKGRAPLQFMPHTWELGTYTGQGRAYVFVYVSISADPERLEEVAISLIAHKEKPFFLLVPSRDICTVQMANTAERARVHLIGLDELQEKQNAANKAGLLEKYVCQIQPGMEEENIFRLEIANWRVIFRGRPYTLRQSVGMQYITCLIQRAYSDEPEIHVSDLFYLVNGRPAAENSGLSRLSKKKLEDIGLAVSDFEEGLDLMTPKGKKWICKQRQDLEKEINQAEDFGQIQEAEKLKELLYDLDAYIRKAFTLSGQNRQVLDPNEKIRKTVSKAISNALARMGKNDGDDLALYISDHLSKGLFCSFRKDPNISWKIIKK